MLRTRIVPLIVEFAARRLHIQIFSRPQRLHRAPAKGEVPVIGLGISGAVLPGARGCLTFGRAWFQESEQRLPLHFVGHRDA